MSEGPLTNDEMRDLLGIMTSYRIAVDALERLALIDDDAGRVALQTLRDMRDEIVNA